MSWLITAIESPLGFCDRIRVDIEVFIPCIEHLLIHEMQVILKF